MKHHDFDPTRDHPLSCFEQQSMADMVSGLGDAALEKLLDDLVNKFDAHRATSYHFDSSVTRLQRGVPVAPYLRDLYNTVRVEMWGRCPPTARMLNEKTTRAGAAELREADIEPRPVYAQPDVLAADLKAVYPPTKIDNPVADNPDYDWY